MSARCNIQLSIPSTVGQPIDQQKHKLPPAGECHINVRANADWIVTGRYRNNLLCSITLKRNSSEEGKIVNG